mgnify:CR=1 FL=1
MRKSITQATRFQFQKFLETVIDTENGCVKYHEGWNDARVAAHFEVSMKTVANTRANTFGKLCGRGLNTKERLADIEARLKVLEGNQLTGLKDYLRGSSSLTSTSQCNDGEINAA